VSAEIINFPGLTKADLPVDSILDGARSAELDVVLVLGRDADGNLYAAGSTGDRATNVLLCREFEHKLLSGKYE
jgi:hypothetical protein